MVLLAACDPNVAEHGRADIEVKAGDIIPGQSTETDVLRLMGTPAATSHFGEKTWYYFGSRTESVAFFSPEVVENDVLRVTFENGVVKGIQHYDEEQAEDIAVSERRTPTAGHEFGFFEQLLGNVGRFNKQADSMATATGGNSRGMPGG